MRYIVVPAEPWMNELKWLGHAEVDGVPVTNEHPATTPCGALAAAMREVADRARAEEEKGATK